MLELRHYEASFWRRNITARSRGCSVQVFCYKITKSCLLNNITERVGNSSCFPIPIKEEKVGIASRASVRPLSYIRSIVKEILPDTPS